MKKNKEIKNVITVVISSLKCKYYQKSLYWNAILTPWNV